MKKDQFTMKRVAIHVSDICNLNCKLCGSYAPYSKSDTFVSVETFFNYIGKYFSIVDCVEGFTITGGEPLLYPQITALMDYLLTYSEQFKRMEIITNGTIVPNTGLLRVIQRYGDKFHRFLIDDYGPDLSKKIPEITAVLDDFHIPYEVRDNYSENMHCGGWVDYGSVTEIIHQPQEAQELYQRCAQPQKLHFCFFIVPTGGLLSCPPLYRRISLGLPVDSSDYIDLTDAALTVDEQRQKISAIYNGNALGICSYCNGMCDDSLRFQPAEQLTSEELRQIQQGIYKR